jgi:ABC-2 type transport system permease protein
VQQWLLDVSPFAHQKAPAVDVSGPALVLLTGVAVALTGAGVARFRRRNMAAG